MVSKRKGKSNFQENGESYGESHVRSESCRQKTTEEQMDKLGLKETIHRLATSEW